MSDYILYVREEDITAAMRLAIGNSPEIPKGFGARMRADFTWDLYKLEEQQPEDLLAEDALSIITGGVT